MTEAQTPGWRAELIRLSEQDAYRELPSPVRARVEALLAAPEVSAEDAEALLAQEPELRAIYRRMHAAPIGSRGDVLDPAQGRKRPGRTWKCPVPTCDYQDWGDRFHPARQDYCPRDDHPRTLLTLVPRP
ncbi:hypothetical protein [Micromonospora sp. NBS 11-29]|uniref:hypothetical protein n=1 Tax=Micromonospora sp. NBS 11-29 TaxID=1960879 RepID=UPI000B79714D|nr:hypothetical protein [Micromonospora sp. NBS 11-29]